MTANLWLFLALVAALAATLDAAWEEVRERQRIRRLAACATGPKGKKENPLLTLAGRLLGWYGRHSLQQRLAQAGNPRLIGESPAHFYAAKLVLALLVGLRLGGTGPTLLAYAFLGFMLPDGLLYLAIRRRQEELRRAMPEMLDFLRRSLAGGAGMRETLAALPERLSGPLREEVMLLAARYALTLDLPRSLDAFAQRTGLEEVEHLVLALKQSEVTGRVKTLLARQSELLKARQEAEEERGARNRANFLPLVSVMVVANIMILVVMPLLIQFTSSFGQF
ncbi:MAG: type II secretion system F family protein [Thermodesulfobacteriota bacterium]